MAAEEVEELLSEVVQTEEVEDESDTPTPKEHPEEVEVQPAEADDECGTAHVQTEEAQPAEVQSEEAEEESGSPPFQGPVLDKLIAIDAKLSGVDAKVSGVDVKVSLLRESMREMIQRVENLESPPLKNGYSKAESRALAQALMQSSDGQSLDVETEALAPLSPVASESGHGSALLRPVNVGSTEAMLVTALSSEMARRVSSPVVATEPQRADKWALRIGERLFYDFEPQPAACCHTYDSRKELLIPCHQQVKVQLPLELRAHGIEDDEWRQWFEELETVTARKAPSRDCMNATYYCPLLCAQWLVCECLCPLSTNHCLTALPCCWGNWYAALQRWMDGVNARLLPLGLFVKISTFTQSRLIRLNLPLTALLRERLEDANSEISFLVFSLTQEESKILMAEPWNEHLDICCFEGMAFKGRVC